MMSTRVGDAQAGARPVVPPRTMCEAFARTVARCSRRPALRTCDGEVITWGQYGARVRDVAAALHELGVGRGDRVALMLRPRPEFHVVDAAAMHLGAVAFSIYDTAAPRDLEHVLRNARPSLAVVEDDFLDRVDVRPTLAVSDLHALGQRGAASSFDVPAAAQEVGPDDLVTLAYTPGTTGEPKGVELTHANVAFVARAADALCRLPDGASTVAYRPMAHILDRNTSHYWPIVFGHTVTCCSGLSAVVEAIRQARPHLVSGMPPLFVQLRAAIEAAADPRATAAIDAGRRRALGDPGPDPDEEVLRAVRVAHGLDELVLGIAAGASFPPDLLGFLGGLGLRVGEVWGLSECTGLGTMRVPGVGRPGTSGAPLPGASVRVARDGELELRSPGTMRGYRERPDLTAEVFTADGWLRSGDVGAIDADGNVTVVDRKRNLIRRPSGRVVAPARIEARLKGGCPLIAGVVVVGDRRPYNVALVAVDPDACARVARGQDPGPGPPRDVSADASVHAAVQRHVRAANARLPAPERIRRFAIVSPGWAPGGEELTPTMQPRRRAILARYADDIDALYAS